MCDGSLNLKLFLIHDLMDAERPEESGEYVQEHLTWTIDELKAYRDRSYNASSTTG